ncbi:sporozoite invasion-associated protein 2, putative [Hepatocystis sp. ex Piliocolobus tephrosceles]|nr:sporozoite invasion-associated protein 2, putative [Hepatocystis sp. ex Piliocolobus tephrosceles]
MGIFIQCYFVFFFLLFINAFKLCFSAEKQSNDEKKLESELSIGGSSSNSNNGNEPNNSDGTDFSNNEDFVHLSIDDIQNYNVNDQFFQKLFEEAKRQVEANEKRKTEMTNVNYSSYSSDSDSDLGDNLYTHRMKKKNRKRRSKNKRHTSDNELLPLESPLYKSFYVNDKNENNSGVYDNMNENKINSPLNSNNDESNTVDINEESEQSCDNEKNKTCKHFPYTKKPYCHLIMMDTYDQFLVKNNILDYVQYNNSSNEKLSEFDEYNYKNADPQLVFMYVLFNIYTNLTQKKKRKEAISCLLKKKTNLIEFIKLLLRQNIFYLSDANEAKLIKYANSFLMLLSKEIQ